MCKFDIQANQYKFPYHYIPYILDETLYIKRVLGWGMEYLTYTEYVINLIKNLQNTKSLLDVGCGDGYLINKCAEFCNKKMTGIDLVKKSIDFAKAFSNSENVEFLVKDIKDIKEKYDIVTLIEVLEHIPDNEVEEFLNLVIDKVNNGGYFIISVPTDVRPVIKKHYKHYNESMLDLTIDKRFSNLILVEEKRLYRDNLLTKFMNKVLNNRYFSLNYQPFLRWIWKVHKKYSFFATEKDGVHIVRVYKKEKNDI